MLQMYLVFVISFTPVWTAGKLSEDVQAALGMASQAQLFLNVVCMGLASGATAAISQTLGALRRRRAEYYVTATCLGSLFAGLIIGAAGYAFTDLVLALTNIPVGIRPVAGEIWKIFMLALPFQYVYSATGVIFRATRMVIPPLLVAAFVALVHAFICIGTGLGLFGLPDWGYRGIAWAGFAAEFVGAAVNCVLLLRAGHLHAARACRPYAGSERAFPISCAWPSLWASPPLSGSPAISCSSSWWPQFPWNVSRPSPASRLVCA